MGKRTQEHPSKSIVLLPELDDFRILHELVPKKEPVPQDATLIYGLAFEVVH